MSKIYLSRDSFASPQKAIYLTWEHKNGYGLGCVGALVNLLVTVFIPGAAALVLVCILIVSFGGDNSPNRLPGSNDIRTYLAALFVIAITPYYFTILLRNFILGIARKWHGTGRQTNREWLNWLEQAHVAGSADNLPKLSRGTMAQNCLAACLPKEGRAQQYEFPEPSEASEFCTRHRQLIVQRVRSSFSDQQGERRLAIGILEIEEGDCLLLFRQVNDQCALFFAITHQRTGTVVNLITQRWSLYNRDAAPQEGRKKSDEEIAAKRGVSDQEKWRARPEWGALGYWHLVDCICHKLGGDGETPKPQTSASDSELDYYEKIVHVETVKESQQKQPMPQAHSQVPGSGGDAVISPRVDFL
jgi:hypothetical protein